ncbi:IS3 family transposase [Turicibacter sp. TJ11]|uniref:IS3 family transposase n=1 Tax=Turicibacter sp. TJ11 TaxID=2806443 RepID=UPI00351CEA97
MSKKLFTPQEIEQLKQNDYVKSVSEKGITYTKEFKENFIAMSEKGNFPREIFEYYGFNVEMLGMQRVNSAAKRWKQAFKTQGPLGLDDSRTTNSGRPLKRELTIEEQLLRTQAELEVLRIENELLKKLRLVRKMRIVSKEVRFQMIHQVVSQTSTKFNSLISHLCDSLGVSRSGYYRYFSSCAEKARLKRLKDEQQRLEVIQQAIHFKGRKNKGIRQVAMVLKGEFNISFNLKSIHRIMKKYGLLSKVRRSNPYRKLAKATQAHRVCPNLVNRKFRPSEPYKVLLTDITYLKYGKGQTAYLSTILDSATNEVLAFQLSDHLKIDFVLQTLKKLQENPTVQLMKETIIHSDQGVHYTSPQFSNQVKELGIQQSMSRKGNCWDNAPQESFFGHLKDEAEITNQMSFDDLFIEIKDYIDYHNNFRYQWNLNKLTPVGYRNQLQVA